LIGAPRVSQMGMIGAIATMALGTWILNEPFTVWHAVGTAFVITGVALLSIKKEAKEGVIT